MMATALPLDDVNLAAAITQAAATGERLLLTRNGQPLAAIVPAADMAWLEALEDGLDAETLRRARAEWEQGGRMTVPLDQVARLAEVAEMLDDVRAFDEAKAQAQEYFPLELVDRLLAGESRVRAFREHRGLSRQALAEACGIPELRLSRIEEGVERPPDELLGKLAAALRLETDDLA